MRFRRWVSVLALMVLAFGLGRASVGVAQGILPDGVFVRDSGGGIWLVIGGQRARVPFFPASDEAIFATADSGMWVVPGEGGMLTLGGQPDFVNAPPVMVAPAATATATPMPDDPPPTVSIQVDDTRVEAGQKITITIIAEDNKGIQWIEWEGTILGEGDNDNKPVGDSEVDGNHRHDCDGNKQCAFVWSVTPTKVGEYALRARARDDNGTRSEWTSIDFRVREGPASRATATPTAGATATATSTRTP
jgi:hypothetical protein